MKRNIFVSILCFVFLFMLSGYVFADATATVSDTFTTTADATDEIGNNKGLNPNFNMSISGTWTGTIRLERRFGSAGTWMAVTNASYTSNYEGQFADYEAGVQYRLYAVSMSSGSAIVRISR